MFSWDPRQDVEPKNPGKLYLTKVFYTIWKCALRCEDGAHRVDLQTLKKLKILKTFQNFWIIFLSLDNNNLIHIMIFLQCFNSFEVKRNRQGLNFHFFLFSSF